MASTTKAAASKAPSKASSNGHASASETVNIGLDRKDMDKTIAVLNDILANYGVLSTRVKNYHWNVVGIHFMTLHKFFEALYDDLGEEMDEVAERIRTLGGTPLGSMAAFIKAATLKEETRTGLTDKEMLTSILADCEALIRQLREGVDKADTLGDDASADFLTGLLETREKNAWMIRAMAQG